jgi:hypothetical protein
LFATTIHNRDDPKYRLSPFKIMQPPRHTILVLADSISAAYIDREAALPGSQLRVVDNLALAES